MIKHEPCNVQHYRLYAYNESNKEICNGYFFLEEGQTVEDKMLELLSRSYWHQKITHIDVDVIEPYARFTRE